MNDYNKFSEEQQIKIVKKSGYSIQFIKDPSEAVQLEAVKNLNYIDNNHYNYKDHYHYNDNDYLVNISIKSEAAKKVYKALKEAYESLKEKEEEIITVGGKRYKLTPIN